MVKYDGMPEMVTAEPVAAPRSAAPTERGPRPTEYHWIAVFADGRDPVTSYAPEPHFTIVRDSCHAALRSGLAHFAGR